jgi:flagellar hook-basal body complex protein FliE
MSIEPIGAIAADQVRSNAIAPSRASGADFIGMLGDGIHRVDESLKTADAQLRGLAAGQDIPIHDVMIAMERARLDLMLVVEIRNRVIEGYQELMRMQL